MRSLGRWTIWKTVVGADGRRMNGGNFGDLVCGGFFSLVVMVLLMCAEVAVSPFSAREREIPLGGAGVVLN